MRVVAPGKLVLCGEYAVIDGAPAVVVAVDRGVACAWSPGDALRIETPTGDDRFVRAALLDADAPSGTWRFEDWNPVPSTTKVGLGGSAAAVVAAILGAGAARGRPPGPAALHAHAARVHHAVQGSGSGIDVAASALGGVLRFAGGAATPLPSELVGGDRLVVVFSGASAATGPRVATYRAWPDRAGFVAESARIVDAFATDPVAALAANGALLRDMAARSGVAYWTPAIDGIVRAAEAHGGAAKPSGAGGGDIVVALFPEAARAAAYAEEVGAAGFLVVPVGVAGGAHVAP
jgi:phosphomevalonate kinase